MTNSELNKPAKSSIEDPLRHAPAPENEGDAKSFPDELVFGFVYAVGTQAEPIQAYLAAELAQFGYCVEQIKLSDLFADHIELCSPLELHTEPYQERVFSRMDVGNKLREITEREDIAALLAIAAISQGRPDAGYSARPRTAYILTSLKREEEVTLLRDVYGAGFFLIAVYAPEQERSLFLQTQHAVPEPEARKLIERDKDESKVPYGQRTGDTFALADVFIPQETSVGKERLSRFVDLVFGCPFHTPSQDEHGMFLAYSASLRSGDLSRQVGATLSTARGEVLAVGCNDVPRYGGGLYWPTAGDQRDYVRGSDSNEKRRDEIIRDLLHLLRNEEPLDPENAKKVMQKCLSAAELVPKEIVPEECWDQLAKAFKNEDPVSLEHAKARLQDTPLFSLTEFGRTVHAEMDALLSCARVGRSPAGATLFSTTFPCHNCTRHIVSAGVARVVYVEPYPKSLAFRLHFDSIVLNERGLEAIHPTGCQDKVVFEPFIGVGPRRYFDLFSLKLSGGRELKRKQHRASGDIIAWRRLGQRPRVPLDAASYLDREKNMAARLPGLLPSAEENA